MSRRSEPRPPRLAFGARLPFTLIAAAAGLALTLAGCSNVTPSSPPSPTHTASSTASAAPTPTETTPPVPTLVPDGTAEDNLPLFTSVVDAVWASPENVTGRAYIDALVVVGFDKAAMQVTSDMTTVGNAAESIQFSVLWGEQCLVGQVGPATGGVVTKVLPALPEGACLVGTTRAIDW